jgi:hypothetical protein
MSTNQNITLFIHGGSMTQSGEEERSQPSTVIRVSTHRPIAIRGGERAIRRVRAGRMGWAKLTEARLAASLRFVQTRTHPPATSTASGKISLAARPCCEDSVKVLFLDVDGWMEVIPALLFFV